MTAIEKLEALKGNETFAKEMATVTTAEELQALFARYDLEFSVEEAQEMLDEVKKADNAELSEEDLENVSGGCPGW